MHLPLSAAAAESARPDTATTTALLQDRLRHQGVGYLALQVQGQQVQLAVAGRRRVGGEALKTDDSFEIGSITKTFTALLLADAVVRKVLTLEGAVEEVLPGVRLRDGAGAPIRWIDLATHRSGLPRLPANMAPAGGLVMDGAGLARYAQAALGLVDHPLREAFALAQREHAAGPTPSNPIGLAWLRAPLNGRTVLNHDGGTYGFSSSMWLDPARGRATAVLANAMVEVKDLALHLLEPAIPPKDMSATRQTAVTLSAEQLAPLVGVYALNPQFKLTLSLQGRSLFGRATGQQAFELFASSPRRFFARVTPLTISFDDASTPQSLTLEQGGQTLVFRREP